MIFDLDRDVIHRLAKTVWDLRDAGSYTQVTYLLVELAEAGYRVERNPKTVLFGGSEDRLSEGSIGGVIVRTRVKGKR